MKANTNGKELAEILTEIEKKLLEKCKADVQRGWMLVGKALGTIRDRKLYRETHKTFEAFVLEEFQIVRNRAYQLIDAAKVVDNLSDNGTKALPEISESTARELGKLPAKEQKETLEKAKKATPKGKKVTVKEVKKARGENTSKERKTLNDNRIPTKTLKGFQNEVWNVVKEYRGHIGIGPMVVELEDIASKLRTESVKASASNKATAVAKK